jgi:hypothetical protein
VGIDLTEHYVEIARQRCADEELSQDASNALVNALY